MVNVTADDLEWAAGWLLAYEGMNGVPAGDDDADMDDECVVLCRRVAAWLDREVDRRRARRKGDVKDRG